MKSVPTRSDSENNLQASALAAGGRPGTNRSVHGISSLCLQHLRQATRASHAHASEGRRISAGV
jgi:hypothetical protein